MKKKLLVLVCACVLALALPVIAFAAPSGAVNSDTTTSTGQDLYGTTDSLEVTVEGADWLKVEKMPKDYTWFAPNTDTEILKSIATNDGYVVGFDTYVIDAGDDDFAKKATVTLVYTTDPNFSGLTCYVYIAHDDGTFEEFTMPVKSDGTVTVNMNKLSEVTFAIVNKTYESNTTPAAAAVTDTKATSPQPGVVA